MGLSSIGSLNSPIAMQQTAGTTRASSVSFSSKLNGPSAAAGNTGTSGKAVIQAALDDASKAEQEEMMRSMLQSIGMSAISALQNGPQLEKD